MIQNMRTYTGLQIDPLNMCERDIKIEDIAHALSLLCRGGGHLNIFYSVAQHSINCTREAMSRGYRQDIVLGCLLHDASEAYLSDIIRPVKQYLDLYLEIEKQIMKTIFQKYQLQYLTQNDRQIIKRIDDEMLQYELYFLMKNQEKPTDSLKVKPCFEEKNYHEVEKEFLGLFNELGYEKS